jgi:hypothetical protein
MLRYYLFKQWQQLLDFSNKCSLFINLTFLGCWIIHVLSIEYQSKEYDPEIPIHMLLRSKFWGVDFLFWGTGSCSVTLNSQSSCLSFLSAVTIDMCQYPRLNFKSLSISKSCHGLIWKNRHHRYHKTNRKIKIVSEIQLAKQKTKGKPVK